VRNPIYSTRAEDPDLLDRIEAFVVTLAESVDELQDAEFKGDISQLESLAMELSKNADELGFGSLAATAGAIEGCCESADSEEIREVLLDLTEIAKRIRMGHRGSV
jgi:HPt (histidine-containing phosphotransfer) domain-containing protein